MKKHEEEHDINVSRRKLLASLGITGAAVASGAFIPGIGGQVSANPNREADHNIYRFADNLPERTVGDKLRESVSVLDFGAIGDGVTDDTQAFQQALSFTKMIMVPEGYTFVVNDLELHDHVTIFGTGTIKKTSVGESALHIKGTNVGIDHVRFKSDDSNGQPSSEIKLGDGSGNIRISNCTFTGSVYSAISGSVETALGGSHYVKPVEGVIITGCVFDGYKRPAFLHSVNNITIATNIFRNCDFDAIRLRDNDGHCIINANQFFDIGDPAWPDHQTRDAIDTYWAGKDLIITNNIIKRTASMGLDLKGAPTDSLSSDVENSASRVIVAHNHIERCRASGISISGQAGMIDEQTGQNNGFIHVYSYIVTGNIVQYCNQGNYVSNGDGSISEGGIQIKRLVKYMNISNNMVLSNYGRGIYIWNKDPKDSYGTDQENSGVRSLQLIGNTVINNGHVNKLPQSRGVMLVGVSHAIVSNNIIENDPALPNPDAQFIGMQIVDGQGYTADKSLILRDNMVLNHNSAQIIISENSTGVAVLDGNIEEGPNAYRHSGRSHKEIQHASNVGVVTSAPHTRDKVDRRTLSNTDVYEQGHVIEAVNFKEITDTIDFTDVLELGYRSSYMITIASAERHNGLIGRAIIEVSASISNNRIATNIREVLNDENGIDVRFKSSDVRIEVEGSRTLQIRPRHVSTKRFTIHVKCFCRTPAEGEFVFH